MYVVYILLCSDGTLYSGSTNDIDRRVHQHNALKSGAHYTKIRRPVKLVYAEKVGDISAARKREGVLKKLSREEKLELIHGKKL